MATAVKFEGFVGHLGLDEIGGSMNTVTLEVYGTNNTPSASADDLKADLAGATEENGYTEADTTNTYSEASGTGTLATTDIVHTATAGGFGPVRYWVHYWVVTGPPANVLMMYHDYGSSVSPASGETFTIDYGASLATFA